MTDVPGQTFDFTGEPIGPAPPPAAEGTLPIVTIPDPRERTRTALSIALIALFSFVVLLSTIAVVFGIQEARKVESILQVLLPPIVALTGSALGFYFAIDARTTGVGPGREPGA